jgi:3-methylfumaryl-CoA hydratase
VTDQTEIGLELTGFEVRPDVVQLFLFSASTWNPHRIHYDEAYARDEEGHAGLVVQGPLIGSWVLELAQLWVDGWAEVAEVSYRNTLPAFAGDVLTVSGSVVSAGELPSAAVLVTRGDGAVVCEGSVTARRKNPDKAHQL